MEDNKLDEIIYLFTFIIYISSVGFLLCIIDNLVSLFGPAVITGTISKG